jgi:hypothetical protein
MVNKSDPLDTPNSTPEPMTAVPFVLLLPYPGGTAPLALSRKFTPEGWRGTFPGLKSVRTPDTVRPIPSAQILPVDIERTATVRIVANFFMIYLFFPFWSQVNCWKTTRLPDAALRRDCRAYEGLKKF